jgi:very-short-patch-repair endonuclease
VTEVLRQPDPMDQLRDHQDDVISVAQALRHISEKAVRHRLATGRWQRLGRSVLVTHSGPVTAPQRRWAAVLAVGEDAVLAGATALDLRGYAAPVIHLLLRAGRKSRNAPDGVVIHRSGLFDDRDILTAGRPPRTRPARSLVDAAQWAHSDVAARAIIAAAFQQRVVREQEVRSVLERLSRARRRRLISRAVDDAVGGAHSLAEIDFVELCRRHGLPEPSLQVVRRDAAGRRRYLDAQFSEWHLHVEVDGGQHLEVRHAWDDMRRQNDLWIAGDRVLRFPAWTIRTNPTAVLSQLTSALVAAGWRRDLG